MTDPSVKTSEPTFVPKPGSPIAVAAGCLCPVLDNHHGAGRYRKISESSFETDFVVSIQCPLHGDAIRAREAYRGW